MSDTTAISWCDATFNPWIGCTEVSKAENGGGGCDNCYARVLMQDRHKRVQWGAGQPRVRTKTWGDPLRWNRQPFAECMACRWRGELRAATSAANPPGFYPPASSARLCPMCREPMLKETRRRVFCASLADVFDNEVPPSWRSDLFDLIRSTQQLDWLLLTKRIGNALTMLPCDFNPERYPHVWIGATVVNEAEADRDVPKLLAINARVRFLSIEPMLGPIDVTSIRRGDGWTVDALRGVYSCHHDEGFDHPAACEEHGGGPLIDWVIAGGESGPKARPAHPDWFRSLRDLCANAGVPFFFKQWGGRSATAGGCELDGAEVKQWPIAA